jgi:hypothetical protein
VLRPSRGEDSGLLVDGCELFQDPANSNAAPSQLLDELGDRIRPNQPSGLFNKACGLATASVQTWQPALTGSMWHNQARTDRDQFLPFFSGILVLSGLLAMLAIYLLGSRKRCAEGPGTGRIEADKGHEVGLRWILILLLAGAMVRLAANWTLPMHDLEFIPIRGAFSRWFDNALAGPPLQGLLAAGWSWVGALCGLGVNLFWLRLPNVLVGAGLTIVILRLGRTLGAPWAGFWSAVLLALLPAPLLVGAMQEHYFLEMVAAAWFVERMVAYLLTGRHIWTSLAASALLSLWLGHMTAMVVAPGLVACGVAAWRRGEMRPYSRMIVVVVLLYLPVLKSTIDQAMFYVSISMDQTVSPEIRQARAVVAGHSVGLLKGGWATFTECFARLIGIEGLPVLAFCALLVINLFDRRIAILLGGLVLGFFLAAGRIFTNNNNTATAWPLLIVLITWALDRVSVRLRSPALAIILPGFVVVGLLGFAVLGGAYSDGRLFSRSNPAKLLGEIDELAPASGVRLLLADSGRRSDLFQFSMCSKAGSFQEMERCGGALRQAPDGAETLVEGRSVVWAPSLAGLQHEPNRDLDAVVCGQSWTSDDFFVIAAQAADKPYALPMPNDCTFLSGSPGFRLYRCHPFLPSCPAIAPVATIFGGPGFSAVQETFKAGGLRG